MKKAPRVKFVMQKIPREVLLCDNERYRKWMMETAAKIHPPHLRQFYFYAECARKYIELGSCNLVSKVMRTDKKFMSDILEQCGFNIKEDGEL